MPYIMYQENLMQKFSSTIMDTVLSAPVPLSRHHHLLQQGMTLSCIQSAQGNTHLCYFKRFSTKYPFKRSKHNMLKDSEDATYEESKVKLQPSRAKLQVKTHKLASKDS